MGMQRVLNSASSRDRGLRSWNCGNCRYGLEISADAHGPCGRPLNATIMPSIPTLGGLPSRSIHDLPRADYGVDMSGIRVVHNQSQLKAPAFRGFGEFAIWSRRRGTSHDPSISCPLSSILFRIPHTLSMGGCDLSGSIIVPSCLHLRLRKSNTAGALWENFSAPLSACVSLADRVRDASRGRFCSLFSNSSGRESWKTLGRSSTTSKPGEQRYNVPLLEYVFLPRKVLPGRLCRVVGRSECTQVQKDIFPCLRYRN